MVYIIIFLSSVFLSISIFLSVYLPISLSCFLNHSLR